MSSARVRSCVPLIQWPGLPSPAAAQLLAQLHQLDASQWLSGPELRQLQSSQLQELLAYAREHSEFYARHMPVASRGVVAATALDQLPLLSRRELLLEADSIHSRVPPPSHGAIATVQTSGSTGERVQVRRSGITELKWLALVMREHSWHERDFMQTLAVIRAHVPSQDDDVVARAQGWGPPVSLLYESGPAYSQPLALDVALQARWLLRRRPGYLLTYPTNLSALLDEFERLGDSPAGIIEVRTVGETLPPGLSGRCEGLLGAKVTDTYSSQEVGPIAAQCPESGLYHIQAESLVVEVLDDAGKPCEPGQIGRVVVTDLHNFATPLIRYDLRDYAQVGPVCPCGRGLPTLVRILGRERNMVRLPTGERFWPFVGYPRFAEVANVLQYQAIQHSESEIELRLVVAGGTLTTNQQVALARIVRDSLGYPFDVHVSLFERELPRTASGKFEEFLCLLK